MPHQKSVHPSFEKDFSFVKFSKMQYFESELLYNSSNVNFQCILLLIVHLFH